MSDHEEHSESDDSSINRRESSSDSEEDGQKVEIREELKQMSFEDLIKLKEKLGQKVYNEAVFGLPSNRPGAKKGIIKRKNHNRPMEVSSRRQVPFGLDGPKKKPDETIVDPRFNANCGEFKSSEFKDRYEFVNEMRENELTELRDKLNKSEDPKEVKKLKFVIQRTQNQLVEENKRKQRKKEAAEQAPSEPQANKKQFFVKKSEQKAHELVKQYLDLKKSGKLEKHLEKRRKKTISKNRKKFDFD